MTTDEGNVEFGYVYVGPETRIEMVEFHVDYCHGINVGLPIIYLHST